MVDLEYAYNNGIRLTTADSIEELIKIKEIAPDMKVIWRVVITENASAKVIKLQIKFGDQINISDELALKRFKDIKNMGINIEGINFHCGSSHYGADDNF
jgi:diaminopimelate decarboxylase